MESLRLVFVAAAFGGLSFTTALLGQTTATTSSVHDPGVRAGSVNAGQPLASLSAAQLEYFQNGLSRFLQVDSVSGYISGEPGGGLGPTYNATSCGACHAQPAVGGTSPNTSQYPNVGPNPQIQAANDTGATNSIPFFIAANGPVREARFPFVINSNGTLSSTTDGGVHDLFTITGRTDATNAVGVTGQPQTCSIAQPNFEQAASLGDLIFRIPTPTFGAGLIENIPEATILANMNANVSLKRSLGISGHPNVSGNDGSITRFGWKAQNKSLEMFSGEAYNVEIGVTNELFPDERGSIPISCMFNATPEDVTNFDQSGAQIPSDLVAFSAFMRFLAPPTPSTLGIPGNPTVQSIQNGQAIFSQIYCDACHTPSMQTSSSSLTPGLSNQTVALYSDIQTCLCITWVRNLLITSRRVRPDLMNSGRRHCGDWGSEFSSYMMAEQLLRTEAL